MIARLEKEAGADATEKAYCDEQLAKTAAKKAELEEDVATQTSRIDKAVASSAQLKEDVKTLEAELAALAKNQAEMDRIRKESHADYVQAKADLELGLSGEKRLASSLTTTARQLRCFRTTTVSALSCSNLRRRSRTLRQRGQVEA